MSHMIMSTSTQKLIQRIGETDQLFLQNNSAELALERADLRLQLANFSSVHQEKLYFIQQAIVLLEQARIELEEITVQMYLDLSIHLGKAYMMYFELTKENHLALITQQILKPLAHHHDGNIYFLLAYASSVKHEYALGQHWLKKYSQTDALDLSLLKQHSAFQIFHDKSWFRELLRIKLN